MGDHPREVCKAGLHPLTPENVFVNGLGYRCCKACSYTRNNKRRREKRRREYLDSLASLIHLAYRFNPGIKVDLTKYESIRAFVELLPDPLE